MGFIFSSNQLGQSEVCKLGIAFVIEKDVLEFEVTYYDLVTDR